MPSHRDRKQGKVFLVGAGPGDPGLLTLKGHEVLRSADVIVHDYLVNSELLLWARADAEVIYVGMHAGDRLKQPEINVLLVEKALAGKVVCRLKGGDPFVFGRGGEEAEFVARAGIPFEIVPGVSAGYAVPAYAGIPLTHRQLASSVLFLTGHEDPEKEQAAHLDWERIAHGASTLVFFMGVKTLPQIAENLIRAGRSFSTPVAVIRWGTRGEQRVVTGTLSTIVSEVESAGLKPPALTVVGDVVRMRETLRWFENRPLFGQRILVTRPREQAAELVQPLRALGAETLELPTIAIEDPADWSALDTALKKLKQYDWLIFTSANGVRQFVKRLDNLNQDIRSLAGAKICAIGPATAEELRRQHLTVDKIPAEYVAEGVIQAFARIPLKGKRILLPRARVARDILPETLRERGARVDVVEAYRTVLPADSALRAAAIFERHTPNLAVFTSSSTVTNFFKLLPEDQIRQYLSGTKVASIGPITSRTLRDCGCQVDIEPADHTVAGLVDGILKHFQKSAATR
jgi:uroporphyrinogen III methyltransferase/synthase